MREKMLKKFILLFIIQIFTVAISLANSNIVIGNIPLDHNKNVSFIPQNTVDSQALVKSKIPSEILISRDQYLLSYNHKTRLLNWVEWKLDITDLGDITRSNSFAVDQDLEEYLSKNNEHAVTMEDYKGSCFDRGHQVPSADRTRSLEDNQETFLLSNMIPQTAYMNRILWKNLEKYTRDLVLTQGKKVYIIAGPIFDENFGKIGVNKIYRFHLKILKS
jgi:DNA/RNA endonuclease G (NUC1)